MKESFPQKENKEGIPPFPHGKEFLSKAKEFFNKKGIKPEPAEVYIFTPESEAYKIFLDFFIKELDLLPFNDEVGKTHLMREDAHDVVERLKEYVKEKLELIQKGGEWDNSDLEKIENIFQGGLEVFKNEIYAKHGIDGIGYNVDLGATRDIEGNRNIPSTIVLERRYISQKDDTIVVLDHGFFRLNLQTGNLSMDLEEFPTSNVHYG